MGSRLLILNLAKQVCEKNLLAAAKRVKKYSDKLFTSDDSNSTVRQRAMLRVKLSTVCAERDQWQGHIDEITTWVDELDDLIVNINEQIEHYGELREKYPVSHDYHSGQRDALFWLLGNLKDEGDES